MLQLSKQFLMKSENDFTLEEVKKFQEVIVYHNDLYYNKNAPIISDKEYDDLFKKLKRLENKFVLDLWNDLVTNSVWADFRESSFKKVKHSRPMISLDNTYNEEDLQDFDDRVKRFLDEDFGQVEYVLEFKFDWVGIELIYKDWKLVQAITRWNGVEWEDVTENIMQIDNIPKVIDYKEHLEVRGEIVMPISSFNELNREAKEVWDKLFSNPRNASSGSIRMKDNRVTKKRNLKFFAYDLANFEDFINSSLFVSKNGNDSRYFDVIKSLEWFGFEISSYFKVCENISEVVDNIDNFWDLKKTLDFEIDGLVIKVNNIDFWKIIWYTEHHPRYAIAYKFPAEIFTTKVISVDHQIWRTWTITPVANLEPINIGGVVVKRATLHNYDEVKNLDVRVWDTVFIKRAWEVIPKIISVVLEWRVWSEKKISIPEICPSCGTGLKRDEWRVRYYCPNDWLRDNILCRAKLKEKLIFAVWKQAFNIEGLWKRQIELFLEKWIIRDLKDVFLIWNKRGIFWSLNDLKKGL